MTFNLSDDTIDVRDIIARIEELEATEDPDETEERSELTAILEDLAGNGGDEQWRGNWYPVTLIRESYFQEYAQELAEDIGAIDHEAKWPMTCIDWEQAARELKMDYTSTEINDTTYYYR